MKKIRKYDEMMNLYVMDDEKLTGVQLQELLSMKKKKIDASMSALKEEYNMLIANTK